jgi:hypothetical protein
MDSKATTDDFGCQLVRLYLRNHAF